MKKIKSVLTGCIITVCITSCTRVPVTGRSQFKLQPENEMIKMSLVQYNSELSSSPTIQGTAEAETLQKVGAKIAEASNHIPMSKAASKRIAKYRWQYSLLDKDIVNAWCLPGGKIAVYSGLLPYTQNEAGLAAVISHEVAHAIAQHGNEKMSQAKLLLLGSAGISLGTYKKSAQTQQIYQAAYGIGTQAGLSLPFSRLQETEADRIGMIIMAKAGYDPHEFINFFNRLKTHPTKKGSGFFSTHPTNEKRIQHQEEFLKEAMNYYYK